MTEKVTYIIYDIHFYTSTPPHSTNFSAQTQHSPHKEQTDFVSVKFTCLPLEAFGFGT